MVGLTEFNGHMCAIGQIADTAVSLVELQKYPTGQLF
jgi:hypothetical protein